MNQAAESCRSVSDWRFIVCVSADGWAAGAPAQAPVAGALQRAVERNCGGLVAQPKPLGPQEHSLAAGLSLENLLPVRHQAMRLSLPSAQWHFGRRVHLPRPRFRDSLLCRDKSPP